MPDPETDLLLGPVVGGVSASGARLWGRASGPGRLHAWVGRQPDLIDAQLLGISLPLQEKDGFAGVAPVGGLETGTRYYYSLSLSDSPPPPQPYPSFQTFPVPGDPVPFSLAFGSCFLPEDRMGGQVFQAVADRREAGDLRFWMLLGDQVYAEAGDRNGLGKVAVNLDEYRGLYEYSWSRPHLQNLLAVLPAFMIMDDHEVDNDWYWANPEKTQARIPWFDRLIRRLRGQPLEERSLSPERVAAALKAYREHQAMHAPLPDDRWDGFNQAFVTTEGRLPAEYGGQPEPELEQDTAGSKQESDWGPFYYDFVCGAAAFFVFDLRTQRVKGGGQRTLLGEDQWEAFEAWLSAVKDEYPAKFLVTSSSVLFDMWIDITRDRWNGFPEERERLFRLLSEQAVEGVYILTGDLHSAHAIRASLRAGNGNPISLWEFCASPFEQSHSILAKYTYHPVRSDWLVGQELKFLVAEYNFGEVQLEFPEGAPPRVGFKVFDDQGELLAEAG